MNHAIIIILLLFILIGLAYVYDKLEDVLDALKEREQRCLKL